MEWQFDALDLRPVERWIATLPSMSVTVAGEAQTITALAMPPRRLHDSYLDTDDWRIVRAGLVLRVRHRGRHDEATLKDQRSAESSGLRQRLEVTEALPQGDLGALGPDGPVGRCVHAVVGRKSLREVLQVRTRRRPFALRVAGVDVAELALDDTTVMVGDGQRPMQLRRVEVEVDPAWVDALGPLVVRLRDACGLQPASLSKFEAGLLALGADVPGPPDLGPTAISPDSTFGELAFAVVRRQLAVLRDKEPGTRLGEDPEELHDMRVATRRLRAAFDLFADVLPVRAVTFHEELGWIAAALGRVRDLDVQQEAQEAMTAEMHEWARLLGDESADPLAELQALLERERHAARADMLAALDSLRWERLLAGMSSMALQGPMRRSPATRLPAVIAVPELVEARHTRVVKAAKRAKRTGQAPDFHRLRIRCKRLRYSLEFSSELYSGRTSRFTRQLASLQDQLGLLQDSEVAATRLAHLATGEAQLAPATVFAMGGVAQRHRADGERLLRRLPAEVAKVGGRAWKDLSATMSRAREDARVTLPVRNNLRALPPPSESDHETVDPGSDPSAAHPSAGPLPGSGSPDPLPALVPPVDTTTTR